MTGFKIISQGGHVKDCDNNPFDRQERIEWWSQERLRNARVLVVGAGAIGNETLKNLALLGIGNILVCDMDAISISNLSRTVLFRREDAGKKKAETAARRTKELSLEETCAVDWFDGDVVWELGTGVFRYFDVVLGCLDNVETRFSINQNCRLVSKPWIDAGISELAGNIKVFGAGDGPCYQCFSTPEEQKAARIRYSCEEFKKRLFEEKRMPTVQISSAIVSALQVQEAIKLILGKSALTGQKLFFQGVNGSFELIRLREDPNCLAHASYDQVIETPLSSSATAREFLDYVSQDGNSGPRAVLELGRPFLRGITCGNCGQRTVFNKPAFRLYQDEIRCGSCSGEVDRNNFEFVLELRVDSEDELLNLTLGELGFPRLHILSVRDRDCGYKYYELSGDVAKVMPSIFAKVGG